MAFNVNAARAQRLEGRGERWEFTLDDETFSIPTELSRKALRDIAAATNVDDTLRILMGEEQYARLENHDLSVPDIRAIIDAWNADSGATVGEDSGSAS